MNNSDFTNLHVHSEYSLLDGAVKLKNLVEGAVKKGFRSLALSDHGNMDGIVRFTNECKGANIKPIYGCELYLLEHWDKKDKPDFKHRNLHLIAHAKNETGFRALMRGLGYAHTQGWAKSGFAARPFLPMDYPLKNKDWHGNVIIQTGCASSPFWNASNGIDLLGKYYEVFGKDLYAELMPLHDLKHQKEINNLAKMASETLGIKPIVTNDIHFLCEEDHTVHDVVLAIGQRGMTWNNPRRWKFDTHLNYLRDVGDMYSSLKRMGFEKSFSKQCILNTQEISEKCSFVLDRFPVDLPPVLEDKKADEVGYLINRCLKELVKRGLEKPKYVMRLEKELKAIIDGGFVRYMLLVADMVNWAKDTGIEVGPGRGSVGGSLVAYLLHITEVDPIQFGLVFERFISEGRVDLPDIDIDFEDRKRDLIEKYLKEKYGEWNVAHVSTFGVMRGKQAIRDVSRVFEVPLREADAMSKCILVRSEADARASFGIADTVEIFEEAKRFKKKYPHVIKHAIALEGQIKTVGIHAAGFVVSRDDLREAGNCYLVQRKDKLTVNWDKEDLQQMGLMKLDVLGLSTLSVLSEFKRLVKERHNEDLDLNKIPLDDKKTFDEISAGNTVCAFQIGSKGLQKYCRDLKVDNFRMLCDASALWRPGCLKAGITTKYAECRHGRQKPEYLNSIHKSITEETYGQIIYQEQIMFLLYNMAGIPWKTTDQVRKVISKSEGTQKWEQYKKMYAEGCVKKKTLGYDEAEEMFEKLRFFGIYAFNLSHAVEYGLLSYWTQWAKIHYPVEFFCAHLNYGSIGGEDAASEEDKIDVVLKEARRVGIEIDAPDINESNTEWTIVGDKKLRAGLSQVRLCGPASQMSLIEARERSGGKFNTFRQLLETVNRRKVHKGVVERLLHSGTLDNLFKEEPKLLAAAKLYFPEFYESLKSKKAFGEFQENYYPTLEQELDANSDNLAQAKAEALNFKLDNDIYGDYRKLCRFIKTILPMRRLKDVDDSKKDMDPKYYLAQATSVKFGYRERVSKVASGSSGTADALGGVYGNLDDGTSYMMGIYTPELYKAKKEVIENIKGETAIFKTTHPFARRSNMFVHDFTLVSDIARGEPGSLDLKVTASLKRSSFDEEKFRKEVHGCTKCHLHKTCKKPVPASIGALNLMVVGEAPGSEEDAQNQGFVGTSGRLLFQELAQVGINRSDCIVANAVACRPPDNKLPNVSYAARCPWAMEVIQKLRPRFILATGKTALYLFRRIPKGITEWNGKTEWNNRAEAWVTYSIHPAAVLYDARNLETLRIALKEFARVVSRFA